ncbi:MAG TPA: aminopeptidase [Solirubrobacteraceae bacterium]|jgi:aminopeptidase|nr:aminopeptidase [Solirubrobacteraceae bacterium]
MIDQRAQRLAQVLVRHSTAVQPGDLVAIEGDSAAESLILAVFEETLRAGGQPMLSVTPRGAESALFEHASDEQLDFVSPVTELLTDRSDVRIRVRAQENTRELSQVDPARQVRVQRSREPVMERMMERSAKGELRWVLCQYPTNGYAAEAEMSLSDYEQFLYSACLCDREDAVGAWRSAAGETERLTEWIGGREEVHIQGPGTDLKLAIAQRTFVACGGLRNMPDGEFFTGPVEDSAEGEITFHFPTVFGGREVAGVKLRFQGGAVVDARAERGEALLHQMLDTDAGSRRLGELGIGTNFQITHGTRSILFDEKIGGTVHLALGRSYPETGGVNVSALHWDLICDLRRGGTVTVDGEVLQRDGAFVV